MGAAVVSAAAYIVLYIAYLIPAGRNNSMDGITGKTFRLDIIILAAGCALYYFLRDYAVIRWIVGVMLGGYLIYYFFSMQPLFKNLQGKEIESI